MSFAVDGFSSAVTPNGASNTSSLGVALTTSNSCVVWAAVYNLGFFKKSITSSAITDNSGQGLTWIKAAGVEDFFGNGFLELWYAKTSAPFASVTITATFATATETAAIVVWGEDGIGSPVLDPNSSLPVQQAYNSISSGETNNISTNNGNDVGFLVVAENGGGYPTVSAGWTLIDETNQPENDNYNTFISVYYQIFTSPQTGLAVTTTPAGANAMSVLIHAAEAATTAATRAQNVLVGF